MLGGLALSHFGKCGEKCPVSLAWSILLSETIFSDKGVCLQPVKPCFFVPASETILGLLQLRSDFFLEYRPRSMCGPGQACDRAILLRSPRFSLCPVPTLAREWECFATERLSSIKKAKHLGFAFPCKIRHYTRLPSGGEL